MIDTSYFLATSINPARIEAFLKCPPIASHKQKTMEAESTTQNLYQLKGDQIRDGIEYACAVLSKVAQIDCCQVNPVSNWSSVERFSGGNSVFYLRFDGWDGEVKAGFMRIGSIPTLVQRRAIEICRSNRAMHRTDAYFQVPIQLFQEISNFDVRTSFRDLGQATDFIQRK